MVVEEAATFSTNGTFHRPFVLCNAQSHRTLFSHLTNTTLEKKLGRFYHSIRSRHYVIYLMWLLLDFMAFYYYLLLGFPFRQSRWAHVFIVSTNFQENSQSFNLLFIPINLWIQQHSVYTQIGKENVAIKEATKLFFFL